MYFKNLLMAVSVAFIMVFAAFPIAASAEEYSMDYPDVGNSGSPLWIHCEIEGMGEYVIVVDPNTNPQVFGFDSPTGYNLINNSASTVNGRAYSCNTSTGYGARWLSYYKLQLQTGTTNYGQTSYEDYNITKIYGTTFDLVDYVSDRGNDYYRGLAPEFRTEFLMHLAVGLITIVVNFLLLMRRRTI